MKRKSKRELVLDIYDREAMGEVTAREIAVINQALVAEFGEGGAMAPAEIARILHAEDLPIRFEQIFRMATPTEKYENLFAGIAYNLTTLARAEEVLGELDNLYRKFKRLGDRTGVRFARQAAREAKRQAAQLATSSQLAPAARTVQGEIAQWLTIWLQTPDLFAEWLAIRKTTVEGKALFETEIYGAGKVKPGQ